MPEISRITLPNGLRLVMAPDPCAPTVGVSLHYGVGFRSEPEGRTGFAHLFEHLMFEGSRNVAPGLHGRLVQAAGGTFNGSTGPDATNFYQTVPAPALERVLFLEADRLRAPRLTEAALTKQVAVVKDEIRRNVLSKPYGRFPWPVVAQTLYTGFADTHDGYGDFQDLERASVADCEHFFATYYQPGNCVLSISGAIDPDRTADLVARHFGDVPAGAVPAVPAASPRPSGSAEFRQTQLDARAPGPALAIGYRLPDPADAPTDYLAYLVLSALLTDGVTSRLHRALVTGDLGAVTVTSNCGLVGGPLRARDPDTFTITAFHPEQADAGRVVATIDAELARLASPGIPHEELSGAAARASAAWSRAHAQPGELARAHGRLESLFGAPELVHDVPRLLRAITHEQLSAAARRCRQEPRALVHVRPAPAAAPTRPSPPTTAKASAVSTPPRETVPNGLPALGPPPPVRTPAMAKVHLGNGLRVVAVRSPAVPLVSVRLRVTLPAATDAAPAAVLGAMLLRESRCPEAARLERSGWTVVPLADTRQVTLSGNGPATGLTTALTTLATALTRPTGYDAAEVRATRTLIAHQIGALSAHPAGIARTALRRLAGQEPEYAPAAAVSAVTGHDLESFHASGLSPAAASLVLVGDLDPEAAVAAAADVFRPWRPSTVHLPGTAPAPRPSTVHLPGTAPAPRPSTAHIPGTAPAPRPSRNAPAIPAQRPDSAPEVGRGAWEVIDRPGAAQAQIRFRAVCPAPSHPDFPAVEIAAMAFGGYSSSRLSTTLRDVHRLTYSARAVIEPDRDHSELVVSFDVRKEAVDSALEEFHRVVHDVTAKPYGRDEIDSARQYLLGRWLAGTGGQDGLAAAVAGRIDLGLPPEEIFGYSRRIAAVRHDDVLAAARAFIVPGAFAGVAVGDFSEQFVTT